MAADEGFYHWFLWRRYGLPYDDWRRLPVDVMEAVFLLDLFTSPKDSQETPGESGG